MYKIQKQYSRMFIFGVSLSLVLGNFDQQAIATARSCMARYGHEQTLATVDIRKQWFHNVSHTVWLVFWNIFFPYIWNNLIYVPNKLVVRGFTYCLVGNIFGIV